MALTIHSARDSLHKGFTPQGIPSTREFEFTTKRCLSLWQNTLHDRLTRRSDLVVGEGLAIINKDGFNTGGLVIWFGDDANQLS